MAGRRIAKSAVDWAKFAERVPPDQMEFFRALKGKSDVLVSRIHKYPEALPKIDWAYYKDRIAKPGMVDSFQKAYGSVTVAYPQDKDGLKKAIDAKQKEAEASTAKHVAELNKQLEELKLLLKKLDTLPPLDEMSHEMWAEYFPDKYRTEHKPTFYPHHKRDQPGGDPLNMS